MTIDPELLMKISVDVLSKKCFFRGKIEMGSGEGTHLNLKQCLDVFHLSHKGQKKTTGNELKSSE